MEIKWEMDSFDQVLEDLERTCDEVWEGNSLPLVLALDNESKPKLRTLEDTENFYGITVPWRACLD